VRLGSAQGLGNRVPTGRDITTGCAVPLGRWSGQRTGLTVSAPGYLGSRRLLISSGAPMHLQARLVREGATDSALGASPLKALFVVAARPAERAWLTLAKAERAAHPVGSQQVVTQGTCCAGRGGRAGDPQAWDDPGDPPSTITRVCQMRWR
jgi:hypothetical protein